MALKNTWTAGESYDATAINAVATQINTNQTDIATNAAILAAVPTYSMCRLTSNYTLTSSTAVQKLFNASTNGQITLPVGAYRFRCVLSISSMSATSGNGAFSLAGTSTRSGYLMTSVGADVATATAAAAAGGGHTSTAAFTTSVALAAVGTGLVVTIEGTFNVTVTGTVIPSFALTTAAAAVVNAGSFFEVWPLGATSVATIGNWS